MLKKEFMYILKPTLMIMGVLLVLVSLFKLNLDWLILGFQDKSGLMTEVGMSNHFDLFIAALIITFTSGGFGADTFRSEYRDNAFEYLFSSPVSKVKIIFLKVIPRLTALIPFLVVYTLIFLSHIKNDVFAKSEGTTLLNPVFFIFWVIFIFFISMFTSIFRQKNWIAVTSIITLFSIFIFPSAIKAFLLKGGAQIVSSDTIRGVSFFVGLFIVFLISAIAFFFAYKTFDVKAQSFRGGKFVLISLIPQLVLIIISIFILIG
ncbi:MAG: hypothetical protein KAS97_11695 [Candidatus Aminicenantes bacterium]|nr:hypothetical protein [Candidatus Aminicenantes bacterium]